MKRATNTGDLALSIGSSVTVSLGASHARAEADATEGKWSLQLPAQQVNAKGQRQVLAGDYMIHFGEALSGAQGQGYAEHQLKTSL